MMQFQWTEQFVARKPGREDPDGGVGLTLIDGFARSDLRGQCTFASDRGSWSCTLIARLEAIPESGPRRPIPPQ
jgi:hypothetical protein